RMYKVNAIVLDKTGTITEGKPMVTDIYWATPPDADLKNILYSLEQASGHPLGAAVAAYLQPEAKLVAIAAVESVTGKGVQADYNGMAYVVGNARLLEEKNIAIGETLLQHSAAWLSEAKTVVYFAAAEKAVAAIAIADPVKASSAVAVKALEAMHID